MVLSTVDEIKLWLKSHAVTWRVDRTDPGKGQKVLFKVRHKLGGDVVKSSATLTVVDITINNVKD